MRYDASWPEREDEGEGEHSAPNYRHKYCITNPRFITSWICNATSSFCKPAEQTEAPFLAAVKDHHNLLHCKVKHYRCFDNVRVHNH